MNGKYLFVTFVYSIVQLILYFFNCVFLKFANIIILFTVHQYYTYYYYDENREKRSSQVIIVFYNCRNIGCLFRPAVVAMLAGARLCIYFILCNGRHVGPQYSHAMENDIYLPIHFYLLNLFYILNNSNIQSNIYNGMSILYASWLAP